MFGEKLIPANRSHSPRAINFVLNLAIVLALVFSPFQGGTGPAQASGPINWGLITFAHEISHYKQGVERLTIQGEMFAQYTGAQVWKDFGEIASDMPHPMNLEFVSKSLGHPEEYNPFISINTNPQSMMGEVMDNHGLKNARNKMAEIAWSYYFFPLYFMGMDETWFLNLGIDWYKTVRYR